MGNTIWTKLSITWDCYRVEPSPSPHWLTCSAAQLVRDSTAPGLSLPRDMVGGVCTWQSYLSTWSFPPISLAVSQLSYLGPLWINGQFANGHVADGHLLTHCCGPELPNTRVWMSQTELQQYRMGEKSICLKPVVSSGNLPEVIQVKDLGHWWAVGWDQENSLAFGRPSLLEQILRNCYLSTHLFPCGFHNEDLCGLPGEGVRWPIPTTEKFKHRPENEAEL